MQSIIDIVVQWATGGMGRNCLRAIIDHPAMELAGVYVYGEDKAGKDAGEIARRPATGVIATRDVDAILALDADVVVHAGRIAPPYGAHDADIIPLLASGKNVISINGYSRPQYWGGERFARLQAACEEGGTSLLNAGLNPGFAGEQLAVVATSVCSAIDHIEVVESVSCIPVRNPDYVFKALGFGADPAEVDPNHADWGPAASLNGMYAEVLAAMARDINPEVHIKVFDKGVNAENLHDFLEGVDLYVDGLDFFAFSARKLVYPACAVKGIPATTAVPLGMGCYLSFSRGALAAQKVHVDVFPRRRSLVHLKAEAHEHRRRPG